MGARFTAIVVVSMMVFSGCSSLEMARPPVVQITGPKETLREITGAFGYEFGDRIDRSQIIEEVTTGYKPFVYAEYRVQPKIKNRDLDSYNLVICKRSNRVCGIKGFKLFNSKNEAMEYLQSAKQVLTRKYGQPYVVSDKYNYHTEIIGNRSSSVSLNVLTNSETQPKWAFSILYLSEALQNQCESLPRGRW